MHSVGPVASSAFLSVNTLNTRKVDRFKVGGRLALSINPLGSDELAVRGRLTDINRSGGMGILVSAQTDFDSLWLASVMGRWRLRRETRTGPVAFSVKLLQAVPRTVEGRPAVRLSALPASQKNPPQGPRFFSSSRRKAERNEANPLVVILTRGNRKLRGRLLNVSSDDGIGVQLDSSALVKVRLGELFLDGWQIMAAGNALPCTLRRVGCQLGKVIIGAVAPGLARIMESRAPRESRLQATSEESLVDDDLTSMLDEVLSRKVHRLN